MKYRPPSGGLVVRGRAGTGFVAILRPLPTAGQLFIKPIQKIMKKIFSALVLAAFFVMPALAQTPQTDKKLDKAGKKSDKVDKKEDKMYKKAAKGKDDKAAKKEEKMEKKDTRLNKKLMKADKPKQ
ncbi:MAG: hypothetical protein JO301_15240 [Chitinophagaceae bacterium]|nr:hypothetical protein [Chitinophagaceae bacterium]